MAQTGLRLLHLFAIVVFVSLVGLYFTQFADEGFSFLPKHRERHPLQRKCPSNAIEQLASIDPFSLGTPSLDGSYQCLRHNETHATPRAISVLKAEHGGRRLAQSADVAKGDNFDWSTPSGRRNGKIERTAVVFRSYAKFEYSETHMDWLRVALHELTTAPKPFEVFLLVDVQNATIDLSDDAVYENTLDSLVPLELHSIALLFNENTQRAWFPRVGEYRAHYQLYQPLQILSYSFPDIDAFWQIEMDARFTDNIAATLRDAESWSRKQPRKNLWERNSQFYLPHLWENCYGNFAKHVDNTTGDNGTWGSPPAASAFIDLHTPTPPPRSHNSWGINEPADLITFSPIIDPAGTQWTYESEIHNFPSSSSSFPSSSTSPTHPPRRMSIIAMTRTSRRLLHAISTSQLTTGAWVVPESTPETFAYLHGLKAVYVPHYITFPGGIQHNLQSRNISLDEMVHKGPEGNRAGGRGASILYLKDHRGGTYFAELEWLKSSYFWMGEEGRRLWEGYRRGEICLPRMILHPVKE